MRRKLIAEVCRGALPVYRGFCPSEKIAFSSYAGQQVPVDFRTSIEGNVRVLNPNKAQERGKAGSHVTEK
jgi:hypothetical protein